MLEQTGNTFVDLSWLAPTANGGSAITGYNIYISTNGGASFNLVTSVGASTLSYTDTGLTNGQTYYFEVTANNSAGLSADSSVNNATPSTVPSAPPSLLAQNGNTFVELSWISSQSDGGSAITGYNIFESTDDGLNFSLVASVGSTILSYNVTGLTNGKNYVFEITANNNNGISQYSPQVFGTPTIHTTTSSTGSSQTTLTTTTTLTVSGSSSGSSSSSNNLTNLVFSLFLGMGVGVIAMAVVFTQRKKFMK